MTGPINRRHVLLGASAFGALGVYIPNSLACTLKVHDVKIKAFRFEPKKLIVHVGDTIRWTNEDLAPHTATAMDGSWDTGEIGKGESKSILVSEGMELSYFCAFHPHMKGEIQLL